VISEVLRAFKFEKPLTAIEIHEPNNEDVMNLVEELRDFFFCGLIIKKFEKI